MNVDLQRQLARFIKQLLILASSQIGDIRDKHPDLKQADGFIMKAASKIEDYLRSTEAQ